MAPLTVIVSSLHCASCQPARYPISPSAHMPDVVIRWCQTQPAQIGIEQAFRENKNKQNQQFVCHFFPLAASLSSLSSLLRNLLSSVPFLRCTANKYQVMANAFNVYCMSYTTAGSAFCRSRGNIACTGNLMKRLCCCGRSQYVCGFKYVEGQKRRQHQHIQTHKCFAEALKR